MELVKDVVKNEVIPAALIMGTGAALGAASGFLYRKINNVSCSDTKKDAIKGVLCSLPVVGATLIGSRESRLDFSMKYMKGLVAFGCFSYAFMCNMFLNPPSRQDYNDALQDVNQTPPPGVNQQGIAVSKTSVNNKHGLMINREISILNVVPSIILTGLITYFRASNYYNEVHKK